MQARHIEVHGASAGALVIDGSLMCYYTSPDRRCEALLEHCDSLLQQRDSLPERRSVR